MNRFIQSAVAVVFLLAVDFRLAHADGPAAKAERKVQRATSAVKDEVGDTLLNLRVRVAILEHLKTDGVDVSITVTDGVAELSGRMDNKAMRDLAVDVAKNTKGVKAVRSSMTIARRETGTPLGNAIGDGERRMGSALLEARVKMKLVEVNGKPAMGIEVSATDGVVRLSGPIGGSEREKMVTTARAVPGVKEVHDLMAVRS